jgi:ABC-type bacteriocin/lantibiotic exporter with double-glycine peptidase domain
LPKPYHNFMEKDNTTLVLTRLIKALSIPVTRQSIGDELEKHPDKGSIKIFSDVLDHWRVPNAVYQPSISRLAEIPLPFIAHISKNEYAVITELDEKQLTLSNQQYDNKIFTIDEFRDIYLGSVLAAEKTKDSGERGYALKISGNSHLCNVLYPDSYAIGCYCAYGG